MRERFIQLLAMVEKALAENQLLMVDLATEMDGLDDAEGDFSATAEWLRYEARGLEERAKNFRQMISLAEPKDE